MKINTASWASACDRREMSNVVTNLPTKFSSTELFPALCPPTTAICGRSKLQLWPMELKASWSLLIRGIKSSIPRLPMVSDRLSARRNGLTAARRSGYFQVFNFHPSNTSRSDCQRLITHKTLADARRKRITAHSLRSVHWSEDQSFVNSQNKTSRYHPVRRHPTSTGDASPASCQPMSWNPIGPAERFLVYSVFRLARPSFLLLTTEECYWTVHVSIRFQ